MAQRLYLIVCILKIVSENLKLLKCRIIPLRNKELPLDFIIASIVLEIMFDIG